MTRPAPSRKARARLAALALSIVVLLWVVSSVEAQHPPPPAQQRPAQSPSATKPQAESARTPREEEEFRADVMMARKEYLEAAAVYQKLVKQEPRNAPLLNKLGIAYHLQGKLNLAKKFYERACKADKTFAIAVNNLGTIDYQRKKYGKAIKTYKKALQIRQDLPAVYSNLGHAYFAAKQYELAMDAFRRALELDPEVFERGSRGGSLLQDRTVADRGLFYFFLAKSFASMGNAERCALYLKKARDEGYVAVLSARTDPAFAGVLTDPGVREVLGLPVLPDEKARPAPPGPPGC